MGVHGGSPLGRFFFGSQTQKVLAEAPVPVMLVRGAVESRKPPARDGAMPAEEQV
jgi:hypothetical protein